MGFNGLAELGIIACSYAGFPNTDFQNCLPVYVLSLVLTAIANVPTALVLAFAQIAAGFYLGWCSMNDLFWKEIGWYARAGVVIKLAFMALAILVNNADFPAWTAYKLAMHACSNFGDNP